MTATAAPPDVQRAVVQASGVRKRYSRWGEWVLDGVDLAAGAGSLTVIAGGNGSGKSTLLRILAGAASPTRGLVRRPLRSTGYVPEQLPAQLRLTAEQYLLHMGRLRGMDRRRTEARSAELLGRLALQPGPNVPIGELSKGNNQKVALAQAFLEPVQLLALDEPDSGLDTAAVAELGTLIGEARQAGAAVLISTHDPVWFRTADAGLLLSAGRLVPTAVDPTGAQPGPPGPPWPRSGRAGTRLVLAAGSGGASPAEVAGLPGVEVLGYDRAGRRLELVTADADGVLRWALGHGWSFVRGEPAAPSTSDGPR